MPIILQADLSADGVYAAEQIFVSVHPYRLDTHHHEPYLH